MREWCETMASEPYIIEYVRMKGQMKVTAIDPVTGREVSIIAPAKIRREEAVKLAVRKLEYVMRKEG